MTYAFNVSDQYDNLLSVVAEVEYDNENQQWDVSYNAAWYNGIAADAYRTVQDFNRANNWRAFNAAIDAAMGEGQSEVLMPVADPTCAAFVSQCENADCIVFKDLRTAIAEEFICELQNIAA